YSTHPRHTLHSFPTRRSSDLSSAATPASLSLRSSGSAYSSAILSKLLMSTWVDRVVNSGNKPSSSSTSYIRSAPKDTPTPVIPRSEEHTSELQSRENLVCRLL